MADEITIREATVEDAHAIAMVHVATWQNSYADILPPDVLAGLSVESRTAMWEKGLSQHRGINFLYVAENSAKEVIGFAGGGQAHDDIKGFAGELRVIYILESYQGLGIGRRLFEIAIGRLIDEGITSMLVWIFKDSPYRGFYERLGGELIGEKLYEIAGENYPAVGYGWKDTQRLVGFD
jgi:GNAT superfamily N-acetyltransferase